MNFEAIILKLSKHLSKNKPWHFWLINSIALLFYSIGAFDFLHIAVQNMDYLNSHYSPAGVAYFTNYPRVLLCLFGLNVLTGIFGITTAFFRPGRASVWMCISGSAGLLLLFITVAFMHRLQIMGSRMTIQDTLVMLGTFGLCVYYKMLRRKET